MMILLSARSSDTESNDCGGSLGADGLFDKQDCAYLEVFVRVASEHDGQLSGEDGEEVHQADGWSDGGGRFALALRR